MLLKLQSSGLSHEGSLLQTPYNINCLNWTLGHIFVYRDRVLVRSGAEPQFAEGELARYLRESEPITEDGVGIFRIERLVDPTAAQTEILRQVTGAKDKII